MPWYKSGTVSVTLNSSAVIGSNTSFIANSRVGDGFRGPDGRWYEVTNIASDTAMAIDPPYQGANSASGGYALAPLQGYVKESADALRALVNQFGTKLAALGTTGNYDILPLAKGGTGRSDGRPIFSEVGVGQASTSYSQQGMYLGWNASGQGEGHFVVSQGNGSGGFTWRSVNQANTASGPTMSYSYGGILSVPQLSVTGSPIAITSGGTSATNAADARINLGLGTASIENVVPITKGGTGAQSVATARNNLGLGTIQSPQFGGLEIIAAAPYIDFHYNNTAADYDVRVINDIAGTLTIDGRLATRGTWCRTGFNGSRSTTVYNFNWTGSAVDMYIDVTYIGSLTLFTSDYRIKKYIKDAPAVSYLDRIDAYRVVTYQRKNFGDVFKGGDTVFQGLIAHEAQAVNPFAASGEKDGVDAEGNPLIQQLDPMALITDLMGAVKELRAELIALKASMQPAPEPATA